MKAAVFDQGKLEVRDIPTPSPGPEDALVKISSAGICHSDVHFVCGDWPRFNVPFAVTMGHEGIGIVEEVGSEAYRYLTSSKKPPTPEGRL